LGEVSRTMGRSLSLFAGDIVKELNKAFKSPDVRVRLVVLRTFDGFVTGLGSAAKDGFKDISKCIRAAFGDKVVEINVAGAVCAAGFARAASWLQTNDLEAMVVSGVKALENSNYSFRRACAAFLGTLLASCHDDDTWHGVKSTKRPSEDDVVGLLSNGFLRGALSMRWDQGCALELVPRSEWLTLSMRGHFLSQVPAVTFSLKDLLHKWCGWG